MCGIAGLWSPDANPDPARVRRMMARLQHRGPDSSGVWTDTGVGLVLGHTRLSIVDLSDAGHQPMCSQDGRWTISYNGEVYNHLQLRTQLIDQDVRFRGHSDTEVLIEAIARWGLRSTLERIDGMFAIALWDSAERELHLVRDHFGEKPVSFCRHGGSLVFASELGALTAGLDSSPSLDPVAVNAFLRYRYVPDPLAIYEGVEKLRPGWGVTFGPRQQRDDWQWFDLWERARGVANSRQPAGPEEQADAVESVLATSVSRRIVADVPVGVFLSGGIDSTLVAALGQQASSGHLRTFTIGFDDPRYDESLNAAPIARHLGTDHEVMVLSSSDVMAAVDRAIGAFDEPFADSSQIPTLLVCENARAHATVAIGGDGGDELFGGYNRHLWLPRLLRLQRTLPQAVRSVLGKLLKGVPSRWLESGVSVLPDRTRLRLPSIKVEKAARVLSERSAGQLRESLVRHWDDPAVVTGNALDWQVEIPPLGDWDPGEWAMLADMVSYLPGDLLTKVDRTSMSTSLEVRSPFLSREVADAAWSIPAGDRIANGEKKAVLKRVLARHVPPELWERPKMGFGVPLGEWLAGPLDNWAVDHASAAAEAGLIRREAIDDVRTTVRSNHHGEAAFRYWDLVVLGAWLKGQRE